MGNNEQEKNKKQERNTLQWLLCGSIGLYLVMVAGAFVVHLYVMLIPIKNSFEIKSSPEKLESSPEKLEKLVRDYVEKEVDRSYSRFFTQFNFALFLIGISVWILRQSVINQLKADVEKDVEKKLEKEVQLQVQNYLTENKIEYAIEQAMGVDSKLKVQLEKSSIVEELSMFIPPEEVFFQEQTNDKIQNRLRELVDALTKHIESHKELLSLTVDDYIKLGDSLYCLKRYEDAAEQYRKATDDHPDAYRALFGIGNALRKQGQNQQAKGQNQQARKLFTQAIDSYKKAININPYYFVAYVNKGLANRRLTSGSEGLKAGIECFDKAIHISPNYYRAWYDRACYYALLYASQSEHNDAMNSLKEAIKSLKRAINIAPEQCKDLAAKDEDFCSIKDNEEFKNLIPDYKGKCEQNSEE